MLRLLAVGGTMTQRAHFWIRIVGVAVILAAEFGPRLVSTPSSATSHAVATAGVR
jgi:hypothetical protein